MLPDDVARLEKLQADIHDHFKNHVRARRADKLAGSDDQLFNGDIWSGKQAQALGLIDGIGHLRPVMEAELLVLDDLGTQNASAWAEEKLYQIIVHRHNGRRPTVITSSLNFTEQAGPISSRVRDPYAGELIRMDAPDYRIRDRNPVRKRQPSARRGARRE